MGLGRDVDTLVWRWIIYVSFVLCVGVSTHLCLCRCIFMLLYMCRLACTFYATSIFITANIFHLVHISFSTLLSYSFILPFIQVIWFCNSQNYKSFSFPDFKKNPP